VRAASAGAGDDDPSMALILGGEGVQVAVA